LAAGKDLAGSTLKVGSLRDLKRPWPINQPALGVKVTYDIRKRELSDE
jgi:hypothetical protein